MTSFPRHLLAAVGLLLLVIALACDLGPVLDTAACAVGGGILLVLVSNRAAARVVGH